MDMDNNKYFYTRNIIIEFYNYNASNTSSLNHLLDWLHFTLHLIESREKSYYSLIG